MVTLVRQGYSQHHVAGRMGVCLSKVQYWLARTQGQRLDRVEWANRPSGPKLAANRSSAAQESLVVELRAHLGQGPLGECGAAAIAQAWPPGPVPAPSLRTIGRILDRRGLLDAQRRWRHPPPPRGWYLPDLAAGQAELDSFDVVEGLVVAQAGEVEVLNGVSLHGGLVDSWPMSAVNTDAILAALQARWQHDGLPGYAQFDNDTRFQGAHQWPDSLGRVIRFCLQLGVVAVFVPPRETGFQAAIENYNGRWQANVWSRWRHKDVLGLCARSAAYVAAHRQRTVERAERAPVRGPWPANWHFEPKSQPRGTLIYLRRTDADSRLEVLGRRWDLRTTWPHRLVRAEVDLRHHQICFYALRRRAPDQQPLLRKEPYVFPETRFRG